MDIARQSQCSPLLFHVVPPHATLSSSNHVFHRELFLIPITVKRTRTIGKATNEPIGCEVEKAREIYLNIIVVTMQSPFPTRFLFFYFDPSFLIFYLPASLSRKRRCNDPHAFHTCVF